MSEPVRPRVSIEIERMTKGNPKVSVRIDGDDSEAVAIEALRVYGFVTNNLDANEED